MQTTGYIDNVKIKVLARTKKVPGDKSCYDLIFKIRKSGKDGVHFTDEENYLRVEPDKVTKLLNDEVIIL